MLTQSKKLLNAVKKLYTKVTGGKTTKSNDLPTVIDSMAENYVGGGSGAKLYQHIVSACTYNSADDYEDEIVFTIYRSNNTPINSLEEVIEIFTSSTVTNPESAQTTGLSASYVDTSGGGVREGRYEFYVENQSLNFTGNGSANNFVFHIKQDGVATFNIVDKIIEV